MRLLIADDSALLREGLAGLLSRQGHEVVGQAASATELLAAIDSMAGQELPEVVITDVRMPPDMSDDGLRAAITIRGRYPGVGIMVVSQYVAVGYASALFASPAGGGNGVAGGLGYLLKDRVARVADFLRALNIVAAGGVVVDPEVAARLVQGQDSALGALTRRELEVLESMARGLSNQQISDGLFLSAGAVSKHVANVFTKLQLPPGEDNRRVRAVLTYLTATAG